MSVSSRLISGTVASWAQIGITFITQLLLVPLYLSYWNVETYGLWLAIVAFANILTALDFGYQEYLAYEFLRIGKENNREISRYLYSGILIGCLLGMFQIIVVVALYYSGFLDTLGDTKLSLDENVTRTTLIVLLSGSFASLISGSIGGIFTRAMSSLGYYPRIAWWAVYSSILMNLIPAVAVIMGADLLAIGITMAVARVVTDLPLFYDIYRLLKKENIRFRQPSFQLGWANFLQSTYLSATGILENLRHQGARLFLTPLAGARGLAAFSTMRTGTNVAMQGLRTITIPLMPELITFLHKKDQARSEAAFATVWIVTMLGLCPAIIVLQSFVEPLFLEWTRGQITFNPWLFATLSMGVLIFALSQPAIAVVRGNNILKPQIAISALTGAIAVAGIFILVPIFGITGAGIALLLSEFTAIIAYLLIAKKWLVNNGLIWPEKAFMIAVISVLISSAAISLIVISPENKWLTMLVSLSLLIWNFTRYWELLPESITKKASGMLSVLPGNRIFFNKKKSNIL